MEKFALKLFGTAINNMPLLASVYQIGALNIFNAISGIFENKTEGTIQRLSFRTLTGSTKMEKMTRDTDLRAEDFHVAGMVAVKDEVRPHELHVKWEFSPSDFVKLRLMASLRDLSSTSPNLSGCYIDATSSTHFLKVINKIISYT